LKKTLKGHKSGSDEDLQDVAVQWFQQQLKQFFAETIHQLVCQWDAYLKAHGDYF
jgi:hypothetical protein